VSDLPVLKYKIIDVDDKNVDEYGLFCQKSKRKEEGYRSKVAWFKEQYGKGLRTKLVGFQNAKNRFVLVGFVEYALGECTWRGIDAKGWLVVHCLWVIGSHKHQGLGSRLLEECVKDVERKKLNGVVAMTSRKYWLTNEKLFLKNGFVKVDELPPFELYAKKIKSDASLPRFYPVSQKRLDSYGKGLTVLVSPQCPYAPDSVAAIRRMAEKARIPLRVERVSSCEEAQKNGVHPYGTFCVILDGKVISYYPGKVKEVKQALNPQ
jgi:N-acetylglutamate synthase-like GNAT family acetyltransferase